MQNIRTGKGQSQVSSSTLISTANTVQAEMQNVLNVVIGNSIATSKKVAIIPGWEYRFVFFDANSNKKVDCVGLVKDIFTDQICIVSKNKSTNSMKCANCSNMDCIKRKENYTITEGPIPSCNCFLSNSPDTNSYNTTTMYYIPIENLMNVEYIKKEKPKNKEKGVKVVLLGMTAKTLRALILHLEFFDDHQENAVKYVDIEVGNTYNFVYEKSHGGRPTTYEIEGKVLGIEEVKENCCNTDKKYVREVGTGNAVYESCAADTPKEEFIKGVPVKGVKIIVDTSTVFSSIIETIMLHDLRDCTKIKSDDDIIEIDPCEGCLNATCDCDPETCEYCNGNIIGDNPCITKPTTYSYEISPNIKVDVTGDKAKVMIGCQEPKYIPIEDILKFYLGDECGCINEL